LIIPNLFNNERKVHRVRRSGVYRRRIRFGRILQTTGCAASGNRGVDWDPLAINGRALEAEVPVDLVQVVPTTVKSGCNASNTLESRSDGGQTIGPAVIRSDSGGGQPLVGGEGLEERHDGLEVDHGLFTLGVVRKARCLEVTQAGSVLAPFMLPELFVSAVDVNPVGVHVTEGITSVLTSEKTRDVGVCSAVVTAGGISAIAVVRP